MSYLVVRCMVPGYEDYDPYGIERNAVQSIPDLWEPERHAEGAMYEAYKIFREQVEMLRRLRGVKPQIEEKNATIQVRALISLARENGWKVKSEDTERILGHQVYTIPPLPDDDPAPYNWNDYVRWLDRQKTREEQGEAEAKRLKEEREAKYRRDNLIVIDREALENLMGDMIPTGFSAMFAPRPCRVPKHNAVVQALVMLADENGWKQTNPSGYRGPIAPITYRIG